MSARREIFTDAWKYFDAFNKLCFSGAPPRDRPRDRAKDDPADHALRDHAIHDIHESGHFASLFLVFGPFFSSLSRPNGGSGRKEIFTVAWEYFDAFKWLCFSGSPPRDRPRDRTKDDHASITPSEIYFFRWVVAIG